MAKPKDPEDVAASIQRSIEVSPKGSRRVRCHRLRALFGFQAWTAQRKELVASLLESRGIRAQPPITEAGLHDWIVLSLPVMPPPDDSRPDPRPAEEWFDHLMSVHLDSEREVEMYFASPLFHGLGYTSEHEAAGFRFDMWEGVTRRRVEADLVYFQDDHHSLADGVPLILVEAKGADQAPTPEQAKSGAMPTGSNPRTTSRPTAMRSSSTTTRAAPYLMSRSWTSSDRSYANDSMSYTGSSTPQLRRQLGRRSSTS
jgi:hypothetical protein